ncbi:MFS transporter [Solidesulfovibrio carbinolicus]|uniref:MFS transporter n=1 Tax=Solidesulfovibrio carbinolicus TaxID=296842 RepID=A0A4P6HM68_9BACT|nr:MFS transporter [Solidesulfovibrio carbinolicus]QAZ66178.1 MFS transporter [Solidesulfovibrio carbinolicus]
MSDPLLTVAVAKARWRLLPFLGLLYVVSYLDRINVSFAALTMNADLGLSQAAYGLGAGIFFVGYVLFEVPSNLILARIGARVWLARIMVSWGLATVALAAASGPTSFIVLRFVLGVAEAGFFPGIIYYLTGWFPLTHRARAVALFMTATPLAGLIGSPLSGWIMSLHQTYGLAGWQWLFLLEGLPAVVLGVVLYRRLPETPGQAAWLRPEEAAALTAAIEAERREIAALHPARLRQGLLSRPVWLAGFVYFCVVVAMYGLVMWLPQILAEALPDGPDRTMHVSLLVMVAYAFAMVGMTAIGASSDRLGERRWHVLGSLGLCLGGMAVMAWAEGLAGSLAGASLAAMGIWGALAPFWGLTTAFLTGQAAAAGIAVINSLGNVGGFAGPSVMGFVKARTGGFGEAFVCIAGLMLLAAVATWFLGRPRRTGNGPPST